MARHCECNERDWKDEGTNGRISAGENYCTLDWLVFSLLFVAYVAPPRG